ncbi:MAG: hypothetical protein RLZZ373_3239 [Pseudomonadota bacterium]|jgi:hypothetical protein
MSRVKSSALRLLDDPSYAPFVARYVMDLPRFAAEVCGRPPTWQQLLFYDSVQGIGSRTSVSSGHGTGKTDAAAIVLLWHLTCYRYSNTILSGPKLEVVLSGVRKYVADHVERMKEGPFAWLAGNITVARKSIYIKGYQSQWWATAKTAPAGKPEAMAGEHRKYLLWLIDEASGVDDAVMGIILGSLTEDWNRIALMSQPTRAGGFFYETHHAMSAHRGGVWNSIRMSSEESPLVNDGFIVEKLLQYGGREDPQYKIKVRGDFPDKLDGQLLSRPELESCIGRQNCIPAGAPWGWLVLVDVAAGEYRDKSVIILAKVYGSGASHEREPRRMHITRFAEVSNSIQPRELIGRVTEEARRLSNATVAVDCGGLGLVVYKSLVDVGLPNVVKVLWGRDCWRKELAEQYANQRSQAMVCAAKAARAGHLSIAADAFPDTKTRSEFLDQHRVPYRFDDRARYRIESKGSAEWEGIPSPDMFDGVSFGFLEGVIPTVSDAALDGEAPAERRVDAMESALLAAIG